MSCKLACFRGIYIRKAQNGVCRLLAILYLRDGLMYAVCGEFGYDYAAVNALFGAYFVRFKRKIGMTVPPEAVFYLLFRRAKKFIIF